jgi:sugar fermentation stimulation protein A
VRVGASLMEAHCANPGAMLELLVPGAPLLLQKQRGSGRKTACTLAAVRHQGQVIPLVSTGANLVARHLLLPALYPGCTRTRGEVVIGSSRFDFMLELPSGGYLLEVKACTLVAEGAALFPDAPTVRGRRHLEELTAMGRRGELRCGALFVIMRPDAGRFLPNPHTDPVFAGAFLSAAAHVDLRACSISVDEEGWAETASLDVPIDFEAASKAIAADRGVYLLVVRIDQETEIEPGALGKLCLQKGHYVYVGSAMAGLAARTARHRRGRKRRHWHVDWLTAVASEVTALPIRTPHRLECELAEAVATVASGRIDGFGCTDCRCRAHLFFFREPPLADPRFLRVLLAFRHRRAIARAPLS